MFAFAFHATIVFVIFLMVKFLSASNFDHACIESITLVLEDDVSKQVTLTRYGQVQTGPNQGLNINGKKIHGVES